MSKSGITPAIISDVSRLPYSSTTCSRVLMYRSASRAIEMNDRREFAAQFLTIQPVPDPLNRPSWTPSDKLLVELLSLGRCGNCRQRLGSMCSDWDMEHMLRVGCGGSNSFRNLQAMDTACHRAVKSKLDGTNRYPGSRDDHLEDAARAARCLGYSKHAEIFKIISS